MPEIRLPGGFVSDVVRDGETVRRTPSKNAPFVRQLLELFAQLGWAGAPRFTGIDAAGRDILSFVAGHVAWERMQPPDVVCEESLANVAELVRQFHDLTAGSRLAGRDEVVCHNDLSPKNTVYTDRGRGLRPVVFLDWDLAAPGSRIHDIARGRSCGGRTAAGGASSQLRRAAIVPAWRSAQQVSPMRCGLLGPGSAAITASWTRGSGRRFQGSQGRHGRPAVRQQRVSLVAAALSVRFAARPE